MSGTVRTEQEKSTPSEDLNSLEGIDSKTMTQAIIRDCIATYSARVASRRQETFYDFFSPIALN